MHDDFARQGRGTAKGLSLLHGLSIGLMSGPSALALGIVLALPGGQAHAQAVNLNGVNNILADGRTKTDISVSGETTSIRTKTVSQGTGFNSFSDFQQAAGTKVNLYVPDQAGRLVNIVRNGPVVIDGVLNAIKNGAIGGDVYFSSPGGFIVGQNGVVNVGSLTANTPTAEFLDKVVRPDGSIDAGFASRLMNGEIPISPDGLISIAGTINAEGGVTLQGQSVSISGQVLARNGYTFDQRTLFDATVNTSGLREGSAMVVRNGVVSIVAAGDTHVGGKIDVGSDNGQAGAIEIASGGDITIDSGATLSADGASGGGVVNVLAGETLTASDAALISAQSTATGDGGFVELSGKIAAIGNITVDLSAASGKAGTLLIDPEDLYIGTLPPGVTLGPDDSLIGNTVLAANVILQADKSITLTENATIDTRGATGGAGDVTLQAPLITIADHADLLAEGNILLDARATTGGLSGFTIGGSTTASISIGDGATLSGKNISLLVAAEAGAGLLPTSVLTANANIQIGAADITATGTFTAQAVANAHAKTSEATFVASPLGVVTANVHSAVEVSDAAHVTAASASLSANSTVDVEILTQSVVPASSPADGALAVSVINSTADVGIAGTARFDIAGTLGLDAENSVTTVASATPNQAAFGASVAVSKLKAGTSATIGDQAVVNAGALDLTATTTTSATITAAAASGGGEDSAPEDGSQTAAYLDEYGEYASTGDAESGESGPSVSVVGGFAVSDLTSTTRADIGAGTDVTVVGATTLAATSANSAEITADGTGVESETGVAAALGINLAKVATTATVNALTTGSLDVSAGTPTADGNAFKTAATSGAGASSVGIAGSFAVNLIDTESRAAIGANGAIVLTGADRAVSLDAENNTESTTSATPSGTAGSGDAKLGIGASVALNIGANRSIAEIGTDATLTDAGDVTLAAKGTFTAETEAEAGSEGGISGTPALALSMINNTTTARLLSGATLASTGTIDLSALQLASTTTAATGEAAGEKAAIGMAIALALVNDRSIVSVARNLDADGVVNLDAGGASLSSLSATASAVGGAPEEEGGGDDNGVDKSVDANLSSAQDKQDKAGVGDADQKAETQSGVDDKDSRSASTEQGGISVAAAVGVNVQNADVSASVADGIGVDAGGVLSIKSTANADGKIAADGSAVAAEGGDGAKIGIGAAVSVNVVKSHNDATLGSATHSVGGLEVRALKTDLADPANGTRTDTYSATAVSGAGASKVGLAGSLALNLIDTESQALVATGASVTVTGGDVALEAENSTSATGEATPNDGGATGSTLGVGASVALSILANRAIAEIADGATLSGGKDVTLTATGDYTSSATAEAGAAGGVALTPALALSIIGNQTSAQIGTGSALSITGALDIGATQQTDTTTSASAEAAGGKVALGAAVAIALVDDAVLATTRRSITAAGDIGFSAASASTGTLEVTAGAAGAAGADDEGNAEDGKTVDDSVTDQMSYGSQRQKSADVGSNSQQSKTDSGVADEDGRSAQSEEGKISVAAAIGVNVTDTSAVAAVPDSVVIHAGGRLSVASTNSTSGNVTADASATDSKVGIAAAAAVNAITKTNSATIAGIGHTANGVTVSALQFGAPGAPVTDTYAASATSGAGGSNVGVAGSLGLNIIKSDKTAEITGSIDAGTGSSDITASSDSEATAEAVPSEDGTSGDTAGIGASVALNKITSTTTAQLADGATLGNGTGLTVSADSKLSTMTKASAGASGGVAIDAVVALALLDQQTSARIGTGAALDMGGGAISVAASSSGDHSAEAKGETTGGKVGVGASAALILGSGASSAGQALSNTSTTSASLARNVSAGSLSITSSAERSYVAQSSATAGGGKTKQGDGDAPPEGKASSSESLDKTKSYQKGNQGGAKVQVAAAVGIAAAQDVVTARLENGVSVTTNGAVEIDAGNATDMVTMGSGIASDAKSRVGIGVGVALGIVNNTTEASVSDSSTINAGAGAVTVSATSSENKTQERVMALAVSGASSNGVSVAGSLAVGISTSSSTAFIGDGAVVTTTDDVAVSVDNTSELSAKALSGAYSKGSSAGVGASIATAYSNHDLVASIGAGNSVTANDVTVSAINHKIDVAPSFSIDFDNFDVNDIASNFKPLGDQLMQKPLLGRTNYYVEAIGGAAASSGTAVQGSFGVMVFEDLVSATIGTSLDASSTAATSVDASGDVALTADNDVVARALSGGIAIGSNTGVGVSSSVITSTSVTRAQLAGTASITNSASFDASATAGQDIWAFGLAAAGASQTGVAGVASVIASENQVLAEIGSGGAVNTAGTASLASKNDFSTKSVATGVGVGGTTGIGGAASSVTVKNTTRSALGSGAQLDAGGAILIDAQSGIDALTLAAAGAGGGDVGVAAGAAVYVLGSTTEALVGTGAGIGQSGSPSGALTISAADVSKLDTVSGALGGAGSTGLGAGGSVGVINNTVTASVGSNATAYVDDLKLDANSSLTGHTLSIGAGIGGSAGLAGAASVYSVGTTTSALIGTGALVLSDGNAAVLANDTVSVAFIAGALAASGSASIGASASVAVINTTTSATIGDNAQVTALGNAAAVDYISGYTPDLTSFADPDTAITSQKLSSDSDHSFDPASGADGEVLTAAEARRQGLRLLQMQRDASAQNASGRGVIVNAAGSTAVRALAVGGAASGGVSVSISANVPVITSSILASIGNSAKINQLAGATGANQSVIVAAANDLYRIGIAGSVAGGTVGVGGGVETAILKPTTKAIVEDNAEVSAKRDVVVSARSHQDMVGTAAAASVGAAGTIAGGVSVFSLNSETTAEIGSGATVLADGNVAVLADDITRSAAVAGSVALDVGSAGMAGSIGVTMLTKTTSASIADTASVTALGLGDALSVYSGDTFTGTRSGRGVVVEANSNESLFTLGIAGSGGLFAAFAGSVSVQMLDITTTASIGANAHINDVTPGSASALQDVVVIARDSTSIAAIDGGVAVSLGGGVAGAVDVGILRNTTSASIGDGADISARNRVDVAGLQNTDVSSLVVSAAGGIVGVAAGVSVYSIGDGISLSGDDTEETKKNVADTGSYVQGQLGDKTVSNIFGSSDNANARTISDQAQTARDGLDVATALSGGTTSLPAGTSASIGTATVSAGGDVGIHALDTIGTDTIAGAAAGGLVGIGAGVGVVTIDSTSTAQVEGASQITSDGFTLAANSNHTMRAGSAAGAFAGAVAAQAAIAILTDNSATRATLAGTSIMASGTVDISSTASRTGDVQAFGAAIAGGGAVGASIAIVNLGGTVETSLEQLNSTAVSIGNNASKAQSVSITASADNLAIAETGAASGGLGIAAAGSVATAKVATTVATSLDSATIFATGQTAIDSTARSRTLADARGIALAGSIAVGGSIATASISDSVSTTLTQSEINAGSVDLGATIGLLNSGNVSAPIAAFPTDNARSDFSEAANAHASGSSGAFVGITATLARATNTASANLGVTGGSITSGGSVEANATSTTAQKAKASGLAVGVVAVGSNDARAKSGSTTKAIFTDVDVAAGGLNLDATGSDGNFAYATSGSGGVVAGAAANATTTTTSTTTALIAASGANQSTITTTDGAVDITARHTANFGGSVDSTQASVAGMSSANIKHTVTSTVSSGLSDNMRLFAADLTLSALNFSHNFFINGPTYELYSGSRPSYNSDNSGWNVNSGSGGLVNVPAGSSDVTVTHTTTASIGKSANVHLLAPSSGVSRLSLEAYNETIVQQRSRLDSGGAIALADSEANVTVNADAAVNLGELTDAVVDIGDVAVAAWGQADIEARSVATTYGLAGAPRGQAHITYTGNNTVDVARNMRLEATNGIQPTDGSDPSNGTVSLNAGAGLNGQEAALRFRTTVDLFNNTAIPIDSKPDAKVVSKNLSNLDIHAATQSYPDPTAAYGISAAGDITLRSMGGNTTASAVGIGKNIYLEALAATASAISNLFGGGDVTFEIRAGSTTLNNLGTATIDGLVRTGLQRHKTLTISYSDTNTGANAYAEYGCDVTSAACLVPPTDGEIGATISGPIDVGTTILNRLSELRTLLAQYGDDPVAAGAYASEIRFLEKKLVAIGLGTFDAGGNFVPGTYAGPSPRDALLAEAATIQSSITSNIVTFDGVATTIFTDDQSSEGANLDIAYTDASFGISANAAAVRTKIAAMGNFAALTDADSGDADFKNLYNSVLGDADAGKTAAISVKTKAEANATLQGEIETLTASIRSAQSDLAAALASGDTAAQTTAENAISSARADITTKLNTIEANNQTIKTDAATASSKATAVRTALDSMIAKAKKTAADQAVVDAMEHVDNDPNNAANNGELARIDRSIDGFSYTFLDPDLNQNVTVEVAGVTDLNTSLSGYVTGSSTLIGTLTSATPVTGSVLEYADTLVSDTAARNAKLEQAAAAPNTTTVPQAYVVDVDDVAARLGNVSVVADRLVGSGLLQAPGDAAITITNNTANILRLGNVLVPTYDAGNVRFNGVLVHTNEEINALNPQGTSASFDNSAIVTGSTSSRPLVSIVSNYDPGSSAYHDPTSSLYHLKEAQLAPDIILKQGSKISNIDGAVEITSAAGNIYVNGSVDAGSVSILAKNGDFVSSYVNGFDHIGGDPASFNIATNSGEAGAGITANGAISIAARYLNINSTIQSGIATWTATLDGAPVLTAANPGDIGISQSTIDTQIAAYQTAVQTAKTTPGATVDTSIDLGGGVILNMAPAGVDEAALQTAVSDYLDKVRAAPVNGPFPNPLYTVSGKTINIKDFLSPSTQGRLEFSKATADAYASAHTGASGVYKVVNPDNNIGVAYDATSNQYVLDDTNVRGGFIQLYGQVMNTGGSTGKLNVLDGFGTISVTNTGNIPVVLKSLSTGKDDSGTGRGVAGVIEITDVVGIDTSDPTAPVANVRFTRYTRDYDPATGGSGTVKSASQLGHIDPVTGNIIFDSGITNASTAGRTASYSPTANQRYVWTTGEYFDNTTNFKVKQTQLFGSSSLTISSSTHFDSVDGPHILDTYRLANGTYVTTDKTSTGNVFVHQTNQGIVLNENPSYTSNSALAGTDYTSSTDAYINKQTGPTKTGSKRDCNWWTLCVASKVTLSYTINQKYTVVTTNSLKADNPISVNFIGNDTGAITVNSASDVVLTGAVTSHAGSVAIDSSGGSIVQGNLNALITAASINLAAGGSVGGITHAVDAPEAAVAVRLTGGTLNASAADGNVVIAGRGSLLVDQVTAAGDVTVPGHGTVNLTAADSIIGASGAARIQGPRVVLNAINGTIRGTNAGDALTVNTGFTTDPALRPFGDPAITPDLTPYLGLSASAAGDIDIASESWSGNANGSILVDQVTSLGGDVHLSSPGYILDNNPIETVDTRTYAQLIDYWESLGLLESDPSGGVSGIDGSVNAAKQANAIAGIKRAKEQAYDQYWQIRQAQPDGGAAYDPSFEVQVDPGSVQYKALSEQYGALVRADDPSLNDQQVATAVAQRIQDYETAQTELYRQLNGQVGGFTSSFDAGFTYTVSASEAASVTKGATWGERQLAFSLSAGALKTVTSTNPVIKDPNVSGRTVTLDAGMGIGETIGAGTADVGVTIPADIKPVDMTIAQKVALATAERSDLVLKVGQISLPANASAAQIAAYQEAVAQGLDQAGSNVEVALGLDESAMSAKELAAFHAAANGLVPAADMTIVVLSKRPLNFAAPDDINIDVASPAAGTAPDQGTIYLASRGDAFLGTISAPGETRIKVQGAIVNAAGGSAVNTGNLILEAAQGGIGAGLNPATSTSYPALQLTMRSGSSFTARAQSGIDVEFAGDAEIDTVFSPEDVRLAAINGSLLNANDDELINILGDHVTLEAANGTIGSGARSLNVGNLLGGDISASAMSLINMYGSAGQSFTIAEATSQVSTVKLGAALEGVIDGAVTAAGRVDLSAGQRLVISGQGDVRSVADGIAVDAGSLKMINGAAMTAQAGSIDITTQDDALVTGIVSGAGGQAVTIVAGGRVYAATSAGRTDITASADGAGISITALGIGDKTQADDRWQDETGFPAGSANAITDTPNALRIVASSANLVALNGSAHVDALSKPLALAATATNGDIVVGSEKDISFVDLVATGTPGVSGNVRLTSTDGAIRGGDITASGSIALWGNGVYFGQLNSGVDSAITSIGDIIGDSQITVGRITDIASGDLHIGEAQGTDIDLQAGGSLVLDNLKVKDETTLRGQTFDIGVTQDPNSTNPLKLTLTGANGGTGVSAKVRITAPNGVIVPELRFVDADITTDSELLNILSAYVPGSVLLKTPNQTVFGNNRSPFPLTGYNVQMFDPDYSFGVDIDRLHTTTDAFVVVYDVTAQVTNILNRLGYDGASLVRDTIRVMYQDGQAPEQASPIVISNGTTNVAIASVRDEYVVIIDGVGYPIWTTGNSPAIQLGSLN